jgi:hypothetical protein
MQLQCLQRAPGRMHKRANFSTLIVGLVGTGDQTRAICVAGSGVNHSAILYDFNIMDLCIHDIGADKPSVAQKMSKSSTGKPGHNAWHVFRKRFKHCDFR